MVKKNNYFLGKTKLAELHIHVGSSIDPVVLWSLAHDQGIKLPSKDFWQFVDLVTIKGKKINWNNYHDLFHWTELIQSSPEAMARAIYEIIAGAYRNCNITLLEISFNPMFRNRKGERDLDQIIMASIHGLDKALLEYPVQAGLIFFLDKRLSYAKNEIIVQKAIKYKKRGVIAVDFAGPKANGFSFKPYQKLYQEIRKAGLGTIVHSGEEGEVKEMWQAIEYLKPERIIHGIKAVQDKKLLQELVKQKIPLALCPTSNLKTGIIKDINELKSIVRNFLDAGVKFCLNTDGPEMLKTNLQKEFQLLFKNKIMTRKELLEANTIAFKSSFL